MSAVVHDRVAAGPVGAVSRRLRCLLAAGALFAAALPAQAMLTTPELEVKHVLMQTSVWTTHFSPVPEHNNQQDLLGIELHNREGWLAGGAFFKNSFEQPTVYAYVGREVAFWQPRPSLQVRGKLTAGLIHGYKGEYQNKIPFNRYGTAPAALPSIGARWGRVESDLILFGTAGMMLTFGIRM